VLRVGTILGADERLGAALFYLGIATLVTGAIAMLGAKHLARLVGYSVLVSMGILLATLGLQEDALTAPVMFYMIVSVLTTAAFFMLTGMTDRTRITDPPHGNGADDNPSASQPIYVAYGIKEPSVYRDDDDEIGVPIPATMAFLGLMFVCCVLLVTGLPPMPGFLAKFAVLSTAVKSVPLAGGGQAVWLLCAAVLLSGITGVIALSRVGMSLFWGAARLTPRLRVLEAAPVAVLMLLCLALGVWAGPVADYLDAAARSLHEPDTYIRVVLSQRGGETAPEAAP
jgi:multicomponent K+:H+ antiporter subunit D